MKTYANKLISDCGVYALEYRISDDKSNCWMYVLYINGAPVLLNDNDVDYQ